MYGFSSCDILWLESEFEVKLFNMLYIVYFSGTRHKRGRDAYIKPWVSFI